MNPQERDRLHQRAGAVVVAAFTEPVIEDALAWSEKAGNAAVNATARARREELWLAWQTFATAGSIDVARREILALEIDLRRQLVITALMAFHVSISGDVFHFIEPDGPILDVPEWVLRLIG